MGINIRGKPKGLRKLFNRIPGYLYRAGLSKPFEANILVLSTKGRKSEKTVRTPLEYSKRGSVLYAASLYENSDWYPNALKSPEVEIQLGKKHLKARASRVDVLEEKAEAYKAIVRAYVEKGAERYYYVKPGMGDEEIAAIGKSLPIMRFEIYQEVLK